MAAKPDHIKDLIEDPVNRRTHNERNVGMIVDALQAVGAARSIVIDEQNVVLAGNGVIDAAAQAGITKVQVVEADGDTIVAVQRRGLTGEQKRKLAMFDNRTNELSDWNPDQLREDKDAGLDLSPFFTEDELNKILGPDEQEVEDVTVPKECDVVWCLLCIPVERWPKAQVLVEQLQVEAKYSGLKLGTKKP
jgi:ParB-like chromosome segregation protein Spo0J